MILLREHKAIDFDWDERQLRSLARLNRLQGAELLQPTIVDGRRKLRAGSYVGVVRLGRETIQIMPKIDYGADEAASAMRNLLYLLEVAGKLPIKQYDIAPFLQRGTDWFEVLTFLFAREMLFQLQQGAYHHYQLVEETTVALKGKWRLAQQLRYPARQHRFDVAYDEYTVDNALNRVFRYVVELLWKQTGDGENRRLLGTLRHWMADITLLPFIGPQHASEALITRLNRQYEPLLNLARLFLQNNTLEMSAGRLASFAFVFDMNKLFEAFIINLIQKQKQAIFPPALQNCRFHPQARQVSLSLARTEKGRGVFLLYPDLVLRQEEQYPLILDTKYKRLNEQDKKLGISPADFYQMYAYSQRYQCPHVLLLYPQGDRAVHKRFMLPEGQGHISAATINLHRDLRSQPGRRALITELREILSKEVPHDPTL